MIDFGIAKALGAELSDQTVITRMGQLIGTPEFMSPEQAVMSPTDIDTRSDVFALGILLYKLLSGVLPRSTESFRGIGFADVHRLIASDSPARMASRFEAFTESEQKATALARGTSSKSLAALLHGELGWVPLKAMQPKSAGTPADGTHRKKRSMTGHGIKAKEGGAAARPPGSPPPGRHGGGRADQAGGWCPEIKFHTVSIHTVSSQ